MRFSLSAFDMPNIHVPVELRDAGISISNADLAKYLTEADLEETNYEFNDSESS